MFDYLQKFNNLPNTLRDKVSSPSAMRAVSALELKYKVDLAAVVMKVMTKTLAVKDLPEYFINEFSLSQEEALALKKDILEEILAPVSEYLAFDEAKKQVETSELSPALIKEAGLSLPSEDLYIRLRNIMLTFSKGVRSKIDAKNALMKKVEFGGLGLSQEEADKAFKLIEKQEQNKGGLLITKEIIKEELKEPLTDQALIDQAVKEQISDALTPVLEKSSKERLDQIIMAAETNVSPIYDLKKSLIEQKDKTEPLQTVTETKKAMLPKEAEQILLPLEKEALLPLAKDRSQLEEKLEIKSESNQKTIKTRELGAQKTDLKEDLKKIEREEEEKQEDYIAPTTLNLNFKRPAPTSSKPRMEDIKPVAKAMGPIDELAFLDLTNFRRLADNSDEVILKIFNKIKLLEKDGYDKMVSGVKAWRQNEVNRLYVKIGQEALLKELPLKDIIVERQKKNMPYLKIEEINAISKLNGRLSF